MKLEKQSIENIGERDEKARRVANLSGKQARITAGQIEAGVTLEALENIGVPVMLYATQATIHGKLPGFTVDRVLGYKALFQNKNGSIGVRYIAVDAPKKATVERALYLVKGRMFYASTSQGVELSKRFETVEAARAMLSDVPPLFIGQKYIGRDIYGGFWAVVALNAIPAANLWPFISWLTNGAIASQTDLDALQSADDERRNAEKAEAAAKEIERQAAIAAKKAEKDQELAALGLERVTPTSPGHFVKTGVNWSGKPFHVHAQVFRSFGRLCYRKELYPTLDEAINAARRGAAITGKGRELAGDFYKV